MIETIFGGSGSTFTVVGDSKQRIMLWAGAMVDAFERFQEDFGAEKIHLLRNYRSAPRLVDLQARMYDSLGEHSSPALPSDTWRPEDGEIKLVISNDERMEADYLVREIAGAIAAGVEPNEICIISKQKIEEYAAPVMRALSEAGIESRLEAKYQELLSDLFVRFLIDCAHVALDGGSPRLRRAVKDELLDFRDLTDIEDLAQFANAELDINKLLYALGAKLEAAAEAKALENAFRLIVEWVGEERLRAKYPVYKQDDKLDVQLQSLARALYEMLAVSPDILAAMDKLLGKGIIPVMTIHKSKGLEYQRVVFLGLEDDAFWSFARQPEEDRCAFFVALSRAKTSVTFTFSNYRSGILQHHNAINEFYKLLPSPGIAEVVEI